jgi:iduronate 2-sulfatase
VQLRFRDQYFANPTNTETLLLAEIYLTLHAHVNEACSAKTLWQNALVNFKQSFLLIAALYCSAPVCNRAVAAAPKPNVLFICVDDLKPLLGCYGDKVIRSPNIDRLSARGVVFDRAYCNQAVCAPSRNSLLTGVRPTTLGIYDLGTNFRLASSNAVTLPQYFMKHGYRAEGLGKIFHVGHGNRDDAASWSVPLFKANSIAYVLPENGAKRTREEALFANETDVAKLPRGAAWESADVPDNAYPDGKIADEAVRRLRAAKEKPNEPFFLAVGFLKPHLPFCAPKKYWDLYDRASFTLPALRAAPEGAPKYAPSGWGELRQYSDIPNSGPLSDDQARTMIHGYHAAVSYMDAQLGKVLDELDRLGLASNTIIALWGDHGWHLGDHGWWCKHDNYEQATRIPLIIAAPGVTTPGTRARNALVETVDIYPTLAELAGLPAPQVPQGLDGKSFVSALRDPDLGTKDYLYHVYPRGERIGRAVRTTRYRLVEWKVPGRAADTAELELCDYEKDPSEMKNLVAEQSGVVFRMRAMLAKLGEAKPQIAALRPLTAKQIQDRTALFERKNKNHDNQLTREEFLASQPDPAEAPKRFERFDTNRDGILSRDEFIHMGMPPKP